MTDFTAAEGAAFEQTLLASLGGASLGGPLAALATSAFARDIAASYAQLQQLQSQQLDTRRIRDVLSFGSVPCVAWGVVSDSPLAVCAAFAALACVLWLTIIVMPEQARLVDQATAEIVLRAGFGAAGAAAYWRGGVELSKLGPSVAFMVSRYSDVGAAVVARFLPALFTVWNSSADALRRLFAKPATSPLWWLALPASTVVWLAWSEHAWRDLVPDVQLPFPGRMTPESFDPGHYGAFAFPLSPAESRYEHMDVIGTVGKKMHYRQRRTPDFDYLVHAELPGGYGNANPNPQAAQAGINKFNRTYPSGPVDPDAFARALEMMDDQFSVLKGSKPVSLPDAIQGLDLSTSPGFPWSSEFPTKREYLETHGSGMLEQYWQALPTLTSPTCIATSALKEEIRKVAKLEANEIRQICAMPIEHTVSMARLFGDLVNRMTDSVFTTPSYIGLNPFDGGFHRLAEQLGSGEVAAFEADISAQDASFPPFVLRAVRDFLWDCISADATADDLLRVNTLFNDLTDTLILAPRGQLVVKHGGNPSGHYLTIIVNVLANYLTHAYTAALKGISLTQFKTDVRLALVGDDGVCAPSGVYTPDDLVSSAAGLGFHIKAGPLTTLDKISFLSLDFVRLGQFWVPRPTDPRKMVSSLMLRDSHEFGVAERIARCCSVLSQLPFAPEHFAFVDSYVKHMRSENDALLVNDETYRQAVGQHLTRKEYARRYLPDKA